MRVDVDLPRHKRNGLDRIRNRKQDAQALQCGGVDLLPSKGIIREQGGVSEAELGTYGLTTLFDGREVNIVRNTRAMRSTEERPGGQEVVNA